MPQPPTLQRQIIPSNCPSQQIPFFIPMENCNGQQQPNYPRPLPPPPRPYIDYPSQPPPPRPPRPQPPPRRPIRPYVEQPPPPPRRKPPRPIRPLPPPRRPKPLRPPQQKPREYTKPCCSLTSMKCRQIQKNGRMVETCNNICVPNNRMKNTGGHTTHGRPAGPMPNFLDDPYHNHDNLSSGPTPGYNDDDDDDSDSEEDEYYNYNQTDLNDYDDDSGDDYY